METEWWNSLGKMLRRPQNERALSDRRFWPLREVQDIVALPAAVPESRLLAHPLVNEWNGEPICINQAAAVPARSAIAVLEMGKPVVHIFAGAKLQHRATIDLGERIPVRLSISSDVIVVEFEDGGLGILSTGPLFLRPCLLSADANNSLGLLDARELKMQTARIELKRPYGIQALNTIGPHPRLLFWKNDPLVFSIGDWTESGVRCKSLTLKNDARMTGSVEVTTSCLSSISARVYLADGRSGRILELALGDPEPRLVVVAGNGNLAEGSVPRFGPAVTSSFGRIDSLAEFRVGMADAEVLSGLAVPSPLAIDWLKLDKTLRLVSRSTLLTRLFNESPFLVALTRQPDRAISISLPRTKTGDKLLLSNLPESSRLVLPLLPFDGSTALHVRETLIEGAMCISAPGPSLVFYRQGKVGVHQLLACFTEYAHRLGVSEQQRAALNRVAKSAAASWPD
ncbi:hypothetical protein, partial [Tahibacter soli]